MIKILFINDEYLRKNFPIPEKMEVQKLEGFIKMSQLTFLQSLTGWCLYEDIEQKAIDQTLTPSEMELYRNMQYLVGMYSYQMVCEFLKSEIANTRNEEQSISGRSIDERISSMEGQITSIEARFRRILESDSTLLELAVGAGDCGYEEKGSYNNSSVYYPYTMDESSSCDS
jgi:hypothetical protein